MRFKKLEIKDLEDIIPNYGEAKIQEMSPDEQKDYIDIYNAYRALMTGYFAKTTHLLDYDAELSNSGLNYPTIKPDDMDLYQFFSSAELKYCYIRNNTYVERLSDKEKDFIRSKIEKRDFKLDDETMKFIEETYPKVICESKDKEDNNIMVQFGPNNGLYFADCNALVIGVIYDEFADNGLSDDKWVETTRKQRTFLHSLITKMEKEMSETVNGPVSIKQYDVFSINRRKKGDSFDKKSEYEEER